MVCYARGYSFPRMHAGDSLPHPVEEDQLKDPAKENNYNYYNYFKFNEKGRVVYEE